MVAFYKNLYQEPESWRPTVDGLEFVRLDDSDWFSLEMEFEREEIIAAFQEVEGDKAPSPNGFIMAFCLKCWCVIERGVLAFFVGSLYKLLSKVLAHRLR